MSATKVTKDGVDVSYRNGFMIGRMVAIDETEGFEVPVPGVDVRIRVSAIATYVYGAPNCILVSFGEEEESIQVWGTMEGMDDVIARDRLQPVSTPEELAGGAAPIPHAGYATPHDKITPWIDPDKALTMVPKGGPKLTMVPDEPERA